MTAPLRIFLVEDHELTRRGVAEILTDSGCRVVGEAGSVAVARALAPRLDYEIALVDIYLRDGDGVDLASELLRLHPGTRVVMLTASDRPNDLFRALRVGASGYLTKDMATARIGETLQAVARGEAPLSRSLTTVLVREYQRLYASRRRRAESVRTRLTPREWQILELLADGRRTGEVAESLAISIETVRSHIKSIMRKLGVHTRAAAVAYLEEFRDTIPADGTGVREELVEIAARREP